MQDFSNRTESLTWLSKKKNKFNKLLQKAQLMNFEKLYLKWASGSPFKQVHELK